METPQERAFNIHIRAVNWILDFAKFFSACPEKTPTRDFLGQFCEGSPIDRSTNAFREDKDIMYMR